jgi:hypothetical protein
LARGTLDAVIVPEIDPRRRDALGQEGFMDHRWRTNALAILVGVGLALGGCSQSPLGPESPAAAGGGGATASAPPLVSISADGTMDYVAAPVDTLSDTLSVVVPLARTVVETATIDGGRGGEMRAGRFSLKVPAGAYQGVAVITMTMPDSTVMVCDLAIAPLSLNKFSVPVQLTADLSSTNLTDASGCTNYWFDPSRRIWVSLVAKSRCSGTLITSSLGHFSTYGSGKAGW